MNNSKFHFEGEAFKENKGKIQIGETIHNYGDDQIIINQSALLEKIDQLEQLLMEADKLDETIKQDLLTTTNATKSEITHSRPNPSILSKINQKLITLQPALSGWQAITATISSICDLLPKG